MTDLHRRLVAAWRLELRLTGWHWRFLVVMLLWAGLFAYLARDQHPLTAASALHYELSQFTFGAVSLLALFLGAISAARSRTARVFALEETLPTGAEILVGRWLGVMTLALSAALPALLFAAYTGPPQSFVRAAPIFLAEILVVGAASGALGYWFVDRLGHRRWGYPLLAIGWVTCAILADWAVGSSSWKFTETMLLDVMHRDAGRYEELWGRLLVWELLGWLDLFHVGLAALFVALGAIGSQARRLHRPRAGSILLSFSAAVLVIGSGYGYLAQRHFLETDRWQSYDPDQCSPATFLPYTPWQTKPAAIDAWNVHVDLANPAVPAFTAQVTLRNAGETPRAEFVTRLNGDLTIEEASVEVRRCHDFLALALPAPLQPGEATTVRLTYRGPLLTTDRIYGRYGTTTTYGALRGVPENFTRADGVRLLPAAVWYPLTELPDPHHPSYSTGKPGVSFRLTVESPGGVQTFSNLPSVEPSVFAGNGVEHVFLIASPRLAVRHVDGITVTAPETLPVGPLAHTAISVQRSVKHLDRFIPGIEPHALILAMLDREYRSFGSEEPVGDGQLLLILPPDLLDQSEGDRQHIYAIVAWDALVSLGIIEAPDREDFAPQASPGRGNTSTSDQPAPLEGKYPLEPAFRWSSNTESIIDFLSAHYLADGDPDQIHEILLRPELNAPVALALRDVYLAHGEAAVIRVLERLFEEETVLSTRSPEELANWIREVTDAA